MPSACSFAVSLKRTSRMGRARVAPMNALDEIMKAQFSSETSDSASSNGRKMHSVIGSRPMVRRDFPPPPIAIIFMFLLPVHGPAGPSSCATSKVSKPRLG